MRLPDFPVNCFSFICFGADITYYVSSWSYVINRNVCFPIMPIWGRDSRIISFDAKAFILNLISQKRHLTFICSVMTDKNSLSTIHSIYIVGYARILTIKGCMCGSAPSSTSTHFLSSPINLHCFLIDATFLYISIKFNIAIEGL